MAKYFRIIGLMELIAFVAGVIDVIITMIPLFLSPMWWMLLLVLILLIIVGPALGLLFISYANHLEEGDVPTSASTFPQKDKRFHEFSKKESVDLENKEKSSIIATLAFSERFGPEDIEKMESLTNDQLLKLQKETFPNLTDIPVSLELNDVSFKGEMIVIGSSYYNLEYTEIRNVKITDSFLSFVLFNTQYVIKYSNAIGANQLFDELKRRVKQ